MDVSSPGLTNPAKSTVASSASVAKNFDDFLTLLTTQLQHQDPLEPLDANEFTSQLVQFSNVEQAIAQNVRLDSLIALQQANQVIGAASFIGKSVEAVGNVVALKDGRAQMNYVLPEPAASLSISVVNQQGQVVRTIDGESTVGAHEFVWDGLDDQGQAQPEGIYSFRVTATDAEGTAFPVATTITGIVTGVSSENGEITLGLGGIGVPLADVLSIKQSDAPPPEDEV